jgi:hypothetical protein
VSAPSAALAMLAACVMLVSCLAYSLTLKVKQHISLKCCLTVTGLHGVISQKIELFITTAVKTSNLIPITSGQKQIQLPKRSF